MFIESHDRKNHIDVTFISRLEIRDTCIHDRFDLIAYLSKPECELYLVKNATQKQVDFLISDVTNRKTEISRAISTLS